MIVTPGIPITLTPAPGDRLDVHATVLARMMQRPDRAPQRWRAPGFARQVELVRSHLRPIQTRATLAMSYAREHFHVDPVGAPPEPAALMRRSATDVAYALRWLELDGAGDQAAAWLTLLGRPAGR